MIHLHVHSEHSLLDGYGSPKQYAERAKALGHKFLGLTDHGNVDGALKWQRACVKEGIRSIIGCEMYIVSDLKIKKKGEKRGHITVIVKNKEGWQALLRMLTIANLEGFYNKPRIDYRSFLDNVNDGLIILTGCSSSFLLFPDGQEMFFNLIRMGIECYLEVMPHRIEVQYKINRLCLDLSKQTNVPLIATNDCHYVMEEQWKVQEVLLAIQRKDKWSNPKRWKFGFAGLHLRTEGEMVEEFSKQGIF
ncbi:MAG: PHP domain-containing protein, partial [Gammaproteobacteria bacterium]|nr:PHP domain-containing protein [Gammaproteobacteria bacterium]